MTDIIDNLFVVVLVLLITDLYDSCLFCSFPHSLLQGEKKKKIICNQLIVIHLGWNVIIKAVRAAEGNENRTCQGQQPTLALPGHFT